MAKKRFSKTPVSHSSKIKPPATVRQKQILRFNFKYLDHNHNQFNLQNVRHKNYVDSFLVRLRDISGSTFKELVANWSHGLRLHQIDWQETSESSFGLPQGRQYDDKAFQFSLTANEHGRIHGFILNFEDHDVFYVVWLDPEHNLYS